ncbi:hypothetical protein ACLOJK_011902 [Asimina triloba]
MIFSKGKATHRQGGENEICGLPTASAHHEYEHEHEHEHDITTGWASHSGCFRFSLLPRISRRVSPDHERESLGPTAETLACDLSLAIRRLPRSAEDEVD